MKNEKSYFKGRENTKLFYQYWIPDSGNIKAYLIMIHGFGIHSDLIKIPAEYLTEKGYAIYSFDLRGHWRNIKDTTGHIDSLDHIEKDIILFMDVVKKIAEKKKIFLIGHSFGGLISLIYAINHPMLSGVIVASPLFDLSLNNNFGKKWVKKMRKSPSPTKTEPYNIDHKELTSDLKILKLFHSDKNLTKNISAKTVIDIDDALKWVFNNVKRLTCPILFLQAGDDRFVDKQKTKKFFDAIKSEDKTYKEYDDFLHELFFEKRRGQVYQDIYIWLEKRK
ncbi:MAG: lysophospholipase [Promethearchaeota archaeon]